MKILRAVILAMNVPLGIWCFLRVGGCAFFADQTSQVLAVYAVFGVAVPLAAALLSGLLVSRNAVPVRSIPFYAAVLPYCAPFLAIGLAGLPEAIATADFSLLLWILLGAVTAGVTIATYTITIGIRKRRAQGALGGEIDEGE